MEKKIEVKITYTDKDIKKAMLYLLNRVYNLWIAFIVILIVDAGIVYNGYKNEFNNYSVGLIVVFLFFTVLFYTYYYQRPISGYISFYKKRKGGTYLFFEDEIQIIGEEIQTTCVWSVFKKGTELPSAFLLYDENDFMYIFPKRCFENESEIMEMRRLLSEKIKVFKKYE